jgi:hypothetical protein
VDDEGQEIYPRKWNPQSGRLCRSPQPLGWQSFRRGQHLAGVRGSTSAGRGNLLHCVTGTLQVLTLYSEIHAQVPLSRLRVFHGLWADGTFIRDPFNQAFGSFDAEGIVFDLKPGGISVSRPSFSTWPKEAFSGAFKEGFHEIDSDSHIHQPTRWPILAAPRYPIAE